jgi:broad specificity phosphatase PhoE
MMPRRIVLIRHAQSEANAHPDVYSCKPDHLHDLTAEGLLQARAAGARLAGIVGEEAYGVFVSPYSRTMQTMSEACREMDHPPVFLHQDPRLREQDYGPMRPRTETDRHRAEREIHGRFFYRFPGGESCADVFDRVSTFLETLYRRFNSPSFPSNVLIFTHGTAMACFLMRWYHWPYQRFEAMPPHPPNGHIVLMEKPPDLETYAASEPFGRCLLEEPCS